MSWTIHRGTDYYFHFHIATNTNNITVEHYSETQFLNEITVTVHARASSIILSHDEESNRAIKYFQSNNSQIAGVAASSGLYMSFLTLKHAYFCYHV